MCSFSSTGTCARVGVRVRCVVVTGDIWGCCVYSSVAERGGRGAAPGLGLEGRLCSMLTEMLGAHSHVATRVRVRVRVWVKVTICPRVNAQVACLYSRISQVGCINLAVGLGGIWHLGRSGTGMEKGRGQSRQKESDIKERWNSK